MVAHINLQTGSALIRAGVTVMLAQRRKGLGDFETRARGHSACLLGREQAGSDSRLPQRDAGGHMPTGWTEQASGPQRDPFVSHSYKMQILFLLLYLLQTQCLGIIPDGAQGPCDPGIQIAQSAALTGIK